MRDLEYIGYSNDFTVALQRAHRLQSCQLRPGTNIPLIGQVLGATAIVIEAGGGEEEAIAALLHPGIGGAMGHETLNGIRKEFGDRVADMVECCTDMLEDPDLDWWARKRGYHNRLRSAPPSALLVSLADSVYSAGFTVNELRDPGPDVWSQLEMGRQGLLWNYATLLEIYREERVSVPAPLVDRLERSLDRLFDDESEKVMARFFEPSSEVTDGHPELRVVSGAVCTGKTRFIREHLRSGYVHVDAPRVFLAMCRNEVLDFPGSLEAKMEELGQAVARRAIEERRNIVVELIGQDYQVLNRMIEQMKALGYEIETDILECDVEVASVRNIERGENNISSYYAEEFHLRWLIDMSTECTRAVDTDWREAKKQQELFGLTPPRKENSRSYAGATVRKLRSCLQRALKIPSEAQGIGSLPGAQRIPEANPIQRNGDEFLLSLDSAGISHCLKALRIQDGRSLCGYVFITSAGGNGFVFTVKDDELIRATDPNLQETLEGVRPAIESFEGKPSYRAYLEASLLVRELGEFGAYWHGESWGTHAILDSNPLSSSQGRGIRGAFHFTNDPGAWTWENEPPEDWRLCVEKEKDGHAVVRFITHSPVGQECLIQHIDEYRFGSWKPESRTEILAYGPGGIIF